MKKIIFSAVATLVVSAAAVVSVNAYNYYSMSPLMKTNLDALAQNEVYELKVYLECEPGDEKDECGYTCFSCRKEFYPFKKGYKIKSLSGACDRCCSPAVE